MSSPQGCLWIVATPIGTLGDFAPRARELLAEVELILAEDTRRVRRLLSHAQVATAGRLQSFHEHNEERRVERVLEQLAAGTRVALVSDAGTPVLSDPGFVLVRRARERGVEVRSVPGPSSFTTALAASGQPPLPATLVGFLPPRAGARKRRVAELNLVPWTLVILLSPHRLEAEVNDLADGLGGERPATLLAELSKLHERGMCGSLTELTASTELRQPRGEYVLVIGPKMVSQGGGAELAEGELRELYQRALDLGLSRREALLEAARQAGISRRQAYASLLGRDKDR